MPRRAEHVIRSGHPAPTPLAAGVDCAREIMSNESCCTVCDKMMSRKYVFAEIAHQDLR